MNYYNKKLMENFKENAYQGGEVNLEAGDLAEAGKDQWIFKNNNDGDQDIGVVTDKDAIISLGAQPASIMQPMQGIGENEPLE